MYNSSYGRKNRTRNDIPQKDNPQDNPQTLPLNKLVEIIGSKTLQHYLEMIAIFLKSSKRDLWFPELTPQLDAFLVRVIRDEQNMKKLIDKFDSESRHYAQQILHILKHNEGVYRLTYNYNSSGINNGLVYKKMYDEETSTADSVFVKRFLEVMQGVDNNKKPPDPKKAIPSFKKTEWINAMISFIEDYTKQGLEYPEMSFDESNYVYSLTRQRSADVDDDQDVKVLFLNLNDAIENLTAMEVTLKSSFLYVADNIVRFSVEKVSINNNNNETKRLVGKNGNASEKQDLNKSKSSDANSDSNLTRAEKALERKRQLIDNLERSFIKTTLKMILNFVNTAAEASLVFSNASEDQCSFIQSACAMARNPKLFAYFTDDCQELLRNINRSLYAHRWYEMKVEIAKARKNFKLRTVSLIKVPRECYYEKRFSNDDIDSRPALPTKLGNKCNSLDRNQKSRPKNNVAFQSGGTLEAENNQTDNSKAADESKPKTNDTDNSKAADESKPKTRLSRIDYQKPSSSNTEHDNNTDNQGDKLNGTNNENQIKKLSVKRAQSVPAPTKDTSDTEDNETVDLKQTDGRKLCERKIKLLKAMAIPMESDIAMRMMRQMGWEGGPLGVRGEGITEPIVPALHFASGAGLGHVRPDNKKNAAQKANSFRLDFLQKLLGMIMDEKEKLVLEYKKSLTKKEKSSFKRTVMSFSRRGKVPTDDDACKKVIDAITEKMLCKPNLSLTCAFSQDSKILTIAEEGDPSKQVELKTTPIFVDRNNVNIQKCFETPDVITSDWTRQIAEHYYPIRMSRFSNTASSVGHRIMVLYKILECYKSDDMQMVVKFAYVLTPKNCNFVKDAVQRINHRAIPSYNEGIESELGVMTLQYVKDTMLAVTFDTRSFTLEKMNAIPDANVKEPCVLAKDNSIVDRSKSKDNKFKDKDSKLEKNKPTKSTVDIKESKTIYEATDSSVPKPLGNTLTNKNVTCSKSNDIIKADNIFDSKTLTENPTKKVVNTLKENNKSKDATNSSDKTMSTQTLEKIIKKVSVGESDDDDVKGEKSVKDYDTVAKECIDTAVEAKVSVELQDKTKPILAATKRMRSHSKQTEKDNNVKKPRSTITYLYISPKDSKKISNETVRKFQIAINDKIDLAAKLPLLECHGVENGVLIYGCHNQIAASLINRVASDMNLKTTDVSDEFEEINRHKLKMKLNSFVGVNLKKLFLTLETYNAGLRTDNWEVVDVEVLRGYIVIVVDVDKKSFQYILDANFSLFAGIDKLRFSNAWD